MLRGYFKNIIRLFYFFILAIVMLTLAGCAFQKFNEKYGTNLTSQQYQTFIQKLNANYPDYYFDNDFGDFLYQDIPEDLPPNIVEEILKEMGLTPNPPPILPPADVINLERTSRDVDRSQQIINERGIVVTGTPRGL